MLDKLVFAFILIILIVITTKLLLWAGPRTHESRGQGAAKAYRISILITLLLIIGSLFVTATSMTSGTYVSSTSGLGFIFGPFISIGVGFIVYLILLALFRSPDS